MIRLGGMAITALWLLLAAAILVEMVGLAGVGIAAGDTRLPLLLVFAIVAGVLVALALFRRGIATVVAVGGGVLTIVIAATLGSWHPDYRPILEGTGALCALSCAWAVPNLALRHASQRQVTLRDT